ncbi:MAG: baseplate J/gp47 family protein [Chloroflexota bacterium]
MTVIYLEIDDEITTAIARLRALTDGEAVVIVPPGSRIATSRINFKLLAREANERRLNICAVSDDPAVRALAISAGLPTYDTLPGAEQALATFREQDRALAERIAPSDTEPLPWASTSSREARILTGDFVEPPVVEARPGRTPRPTTETQVLPVVDEPVERADRPDRRRRRQRVPVAPVLVVGLLALLVAGVAYGAYVFLPTATITLTPDTTQLRLDSFTVIADPNVAVLDAAAGTLPAQPIELPLHVADTFDATGVTVRETRASGSVRFRSENTVETVDVAEGTVVETADGVAFETTKPATVPKAIFGAEAGTVDVPVRAVRVGTRGNVERGAITELPKFLKDQLVSVRNPDPTEGGRRTETLTITQADYDAALLSLTGQLDSALVAALANPDAIPRGLTAYPETATHGEPTPDQPANALVDTEADTFTLAADATGRVLAVNEALIDEMARTRLDDALSPGQQAVGDPSISHGPGVVADQFISYSVSATTEVFSAPEVPTLVGLVRGKTVTEARAILAQYGMVDIVMWPDFVDRLPDQTSRISLTIRSPSAGS